MQLHDRTSIPQNIVQLDADGLNLWLAALRNTTAIVAVDGFTSLRDLFPQALQLLATNLDLLGSITGIMESYFLLDAIHILQVSEVVCPLVDPYSFWL